MCELTDRISSHTLTLYDILKTPPYYSLSNSEISDWVYEFIVVSYLQGDFSDCTWGDIITYLKYIILCIVCLIFVLRVLTIIRDSSSFLVQAQEYAEAVQQGASWIVGCFPSPAFQGSLGVYPSQKRKTGTNYNLTLMETGDLQRPQTWSTMLS